MKSMFKMMSSCSIPGDLDDLVLFLSCSWIFDISHCIFGVNVPPPSINECNILINGDDIVFA